MYKYDNQPSTPAKCCPLGRIHNHAAQYLTEMVGASCVRTKGSVTVFLSLGERCQQVVTLGLPTYDLSIVRAVPFLFIICMCLFFKRKKKDCR